MASSVGHSAMNRYGTTIKQVLLAKPGLVGHDFDMNRVEIFKQLVKHRLANPLEADDIKVFIKPEPHKMSKLRENRFRLISAVSLTDTMVDRVMFGWLMRKALKNVGNTPCLLGWSPLAGGYRLLLETFSRTRGLDKTAWDWTVQGWVLRAIRDIIKELAVCASDAWKEWVDTRWEVLFRDAVFQFSDGERVKQPGWGVMKSGCYLTILINSIGQMLYHAIALIELGKPVDYVPFVTIGDDVTLEDFPEFPEYERILKKYGALLKPSEVEEDKVEFAGFVASRENGGSCWPEYWQKHCFVMTHVSSSLPELLQSYLILYNFQPEKREWIKRQLVRIDPGKVISDYSARAIWTR